MTVAEQLHAAIAALPEGTRISPVWGIVRSDNIWVLSYGECCPMGALIVGDTIECGLLPTLAAQKLGVDSNFVMDFITGFDGEIEGLDNEAYQLGRQFNAQYIKERS